MFQISVFVDTLRVFATTHVGKKTQEGRKT